MSKTAGMSRDFLSGKALPHHKPFPLLTKSRQLAREEIRLYGHPKKLN
jgi:hypothetical protein